MPVVSGFNEGGSIRRAASDDDFCAVRLGLSGTTLLNEPASYGDCEVKRGAASELRFHPDTPAVTLDDLLADGQADARAGVLVLGCAGAGRSRRCARHTGVRCRCRCRGTEKSHSCPCLARRRDVHSGRLVTVKLDGVADQVLEQLAELQCRRPARWAAGRGSPPRRSLRSPS